MRTSSTGYRGTGWAIRLITCLALASTGGQRFALVGSMALTVALTVVLAGGIVEAKDVERFIKVTDHDGEPVTDLGAGDFTVEHAGERVDLAHVELVDQPLRVALIVDDADGALPFFRYFRVYLPRFVRALPENSEIGLVLLSGRPRLVVDFTDDHDAVLDELARLFVQEDYAAGFFAGLEETVDRWDDDLRWPVLAVVTTDGPAQRTLTDGRYGAFIERVVERGAVIHALGLYTQRAAAGRGFQTGIARDVTRVTGGWYGTVAGPSQSIGEKLQEMAGEITRQYEQTRYQYAVAYEPPPGTDPEAGISCAVRRARVHLRERASAARRGRRVERDRRHGRQPRGAVQPGRVGLRGGGLCTGRRVVSEGPRAGRALGEAAVQAGAGLAQLGRHRRGEAVVRAGGRDGAGLARRRAGDRHPGFAAVTEAAGGHWRQPRRGPGRRARGRPGPRGRLEPRPGEPATRCRHR